MSQALDTWRWRLDYLQQQEAIVSEAAQKFALAEQKSALPVHEILLERGTEKELNRLAPDVFQRVVIHMYQTACAVGHFVRRS